MADKHEHTTGMHMPPKESAPTKETTKAQKAPNPKAPDAKPVKKAAPKV